MIGLVYRLKRWCFGAPGWGAIGDRCSLSLRGSSGPIRIISTILVSRCGSPVLSLFFWRGPAAIPWFIIPVPIRPSVEGLPFWALAHIIKESFKRKLPFLAYCYPASSIIVVLRVVRVIASCSHGAPRHKSSAWRPPDCMPMRCEFLFPRALPCAATRYPSAVLEVVCSG